MKKILSNAVWVLIGLAGAGAYATIAWHRGEQLNSVYILVAALCSYAIGYRFYSKWIATQVLMVDDRRATPCEVHDDGKDFVRTNKWIVFGHHFAAISGPGPLVGPVLASQFGYLPGTLWILIGVTLGGAVQDFVVLFCSMRRNGKSLAQMVKEELNTTAGAIGVAAILGIMIILLAVLALVVVKALAESSWGVFTVGATIPIAMVMGIYMRFWRIGRVMEASVIGVIFLLLAVWGGKLVHESSSLSHLFGLREMTLAWAIILYGLAASTLPVWLLLAPRDYLSTFMKLGTIFALVLGIFLVLPDLRMPAISRFVDGSGLVVAGKLFPFCFITIACGAISGFHTLIASGTTPKLITRESYARPIGYGAMCLESLVAIMALIAACTLEPGVYLSMNVKGAPAATVSTINSLGFSVTVEQMNQLAAQLGEKTLFGRTGGAATLAVGMAHIFSRVVSGRWLDLWYHFAIMFEALFILTTLDAGTRVGRYLLQEVLGNIWKPLGDTRSVQANILASLLIVVGWGYFLIQGVRDPLGGINSLWPLFGIANQLLAAIGLCLGTTIVLKMALRSEASPGKAAKPALALITLLPLAWLLAVTMTSGVQKIFHPDPRIGFLAQTKTLREKAPALAAALAKAKASGIELEVQTATKALRLNRVLQFNNMLDAFVAGAFLLLVAAIAVLSVREWILLLARRKLALLRETAPVWLPEYALASSKPMHLAGLIALAVALARELSGEAHLERVRLEVAADKQSHRDCIALDQSDPFALLGPVERRHSPDPNSGPQLESRESTPCSLSEQEIYLKATEHRFQGIRRCC